MADLVSHANRDRFLTARWNNILTLVLGLPAVVFALVALTGDTFSDRTVFLVLVIVGAFY